MTPEVVLRDFLAERFGSYREDLGCDEPLDDIVDSLGLFELLAFLETRFRMRIPNEEFSPQRFATIDGILAVIDEYRAP